MRIGFTPILLCMVMASTTPTVGEEIISALSQNRISITANFDGSEIFVYGAVKREAPIADGDLGIIVTVVGPFEPTLVRRKDRIFGIWVNANAFKIDTAPTFYAVASSAPLKEILRESESVRNQIPIEEKIEAKSSADSQSFLDALVRIREKQGLYSELPDMVDLRSDTLFGTHIALPANLVEGEYTATVYVTRDGTIVDKQESKIDVQKVGLERWIYTLAHQQPLVYGLLAVLLATFTGWAASVVFRRI